ncbi:MAG: hypothetical protein NTU61_03660 [Candidatus Altiarchaeota archaeon]|nr:hypothetical protein [Candidatus Altiarchaeota archaeon]
MNKKGVLFTTGLGLAGLAILALSTYYMDYSASNYLVEAPVSVKVASQYTAFENAIAEIVRENSGVDVTTSGSRLMVNTSLPNDMSVMQERLNNLKGVGEANFNATLNVAGMKDNFVLYATQFNATVTENTASSIKVNMTQAPYDISVQLLIRENVSSCDLVKAAGNTTIKIEVMGTPGYCQKTSSVNSSDANTFTVNGGVITVTVNNNIMSVSTGYVTPMATNMQISFANSTNISKVIIPGNVITVRDGRFDVRKTGGVRVK